MNAYKVPLRLGLLLALVFALETSAALAKCRDRPKPGVDWSRCEKERLILRAPSGTRGTRASGRC